MPVRGIKDISCRIFFIKTTAKIFLTIKYYIREKDKKREAETSLNFFILDKTKQ